MSAKPNDFKLGLFALIGIVLLLAALVLFGALKILHGKTTEETYVTGDVSGLKSGAPVLLRGVTVGEVKSINFSWNVYHRPEPR
jgi:phospholipid/cholesterol/gamma-HCH transport system substrate-binding protein